MKQCTTGKLPFLFLKSFLLALTKFSFWEENWAIGYNFMKFWDLLNISKFLKILTLKMFTKSRDNFYVQCFLLIMTTPLTCGDRKILSNIKIYQKVVTKIVWTILFCFLCLYYVSCWKQSFFRRIYFILLKEHHNPNFKGFLY